MINEITDFSKSIKYNKLLADSSLQSGLYILLELNEKLEITEKQEKVYKKGDEVSAFFRTCLQYNLNSEPISHRKIFDSNKKIFNRTCTPFGIGFTKRNFINKGGEIIQKSLSLYFKTAEKYLKTDSERKWWKIFQRFCKTELEHYLEKLKEYQDLAKSKSVYLFLSNLEPAEYEPSHSRYIEEKVFNKEKYNLEIDGAIYGVSDALSTFQEKKPYLQHRTAPFNISYRVSGEEALHIYRFFNLLKKRKLPNPLPIFIEKEELNESVVALFNDEKVVSYSQLIKKLYNRHKQDLGNYYLLYFNGDRLQDLDFVSNFKYKVDNIVINNIMGVKGQKYIDRIGDIFEFEKKIVGKIFKYVLVPKNPSYVNYFTAVDKLQKMISLRNRKSTLQLLLKYRKNFYDFIYKSKRSAVPQHIFDEIIENEICEDIRLDENRKYDYHIKEKLNIWYSLYNYFQGGKNRKIKDMEGTIEQLQQQASKLAKNDSIHVENDKEFAFIAGQVIYYLLSLSKSSNKSHALLDPFLNKNNVKQLKAEIERIFNAYKHEIYFSNKGFGRFMSEVMVYNPNIEKIKELKPFILGGYFSDSILYKSQEE